MNASLEAIRPGGHAELLDIAKSYAQPGMHDGTHPSSREDLSGGPLRFSFATVSPRILLDHAPWIEQFYRGPLLEKAREFAGRLVLASTSVENYPLLNIHRWNAQVQQGEGYECHVDTNWPTGLYFLGDKDRDSSTGGALAVSTLGDVPSRVDVLRSCTRYYPKIGEYAVMNGYGVSHCVEPSIDATDRVMLVCNFWTKDVPEASRGAGLETYQQGVLNT